MGAWGVGIFENDDACDYIASILDQSDLTQIDAKLDQILNRKEAYLEAPEGSEGLAAAEIVARLKGNWGVRDAYTAELDKWVEVVGAVPTNEIVAKARGCVARVLREPSELLELWGEGGELEVWKATVLDLLERLV